MLVKSIPGINKKLLYGLVDKEPRGGGPDLARDPDLPTPELVS